MTHSLFDTYRRTVMPEDVPQGRGPGAGRLQLRIESLENLNDTIDQLFERLEREGRPELLETLCPYFGVVWPSARALAQVLAEVDSRELARKGVLEVGCGLALPSLVAARRGAYVTASDYHPDIEAFLSRNLAHNGLEGRVKYVHQDWTKIPLAARYDWVVGSDILYERQHPAFVARALAAAVAPGGRIVVADPGRPYLQSFTDEMAALGFESELSSVRVPDREVYVLEFAADG
jgi:predicted nicotinamide N-methyase